MAADGGWKNADGKMRMIKCGWKCGCKNADGQLPIDDTMQIIKSQRGKINLRYFLKVLFVTKPSYLIELRLGEVQYLIFNWKQVKTL